VLNDLLAVLLARACALVHEKLQLSSRVSGDISKAASLRRGQKRTAAGSVVAVNGTRQVCGVPCFIVRSGLSTRCAAIRGSVKAENPHPEPARLHRGSLTTWRCRAGNRVNLDQRRQILADRSGDQRGSRTKSPKKRILLFFFPPLF